MHPACQDPGLVIPGGWKQGVSGKPDSTSREGDRSDGGMVLAPAGAGAAQRAVGDREIRIGESAYRFAEGDRDQRRLACGQRVVGDRVNIETDIVARHVERMLQFHTKGGLA